MSSRLHFFRRNDAFFWRRRLPRRVAEIYGRTHVCRSLKTSDPRQARRRALQLSIGFEAIMEKVENAIAAGRPPTKADLDRALVELFDCITAECEEWLATRTPYLRLRNYASDQEYHADGDRQYDEFMHPEKQRRDWQTYLDVGDYEEASARLATILADKGIEIDRDSLEFKVLSARGMRVGVEAFSRFLRSFEGEELNDSLKALIDRRQEPSISAAVVGQPSIRVVEAAPTPAAKTASSKLSSFKQAFVNQAVKEGRWKGQTTAQNSNSIDLLVRIVGDKSVNELKRADAEKLRRTLEQIPQNFGKSPKHFELPIEQVIAERKKDTRTLSRGTLDRHWNTIVGYIRWLNRQDDIEPINIDRIFGGFRWGVDVPEPEERLEWDDEAIETLFSSPIWTGCLPDSKRRYWRHRPGAYIMQDAYWWLPLLGIYHGGREDEYCQLTRKDIYEVDGIWVMDFHGPHLKTKASKRIVPIHSAMIELGFLDLVRSVKAGRLFPYMKAGGRDEKYSHFYTEQFTQYRRKIGVYKHLMDFHSFRINATSKMMRAGASILQADEVTGHDSQMRKDLKETKSVTLDYFRGFELPQRRDVVETIQYPTIDLDRLKKDLAEARSWKWK